MAKPNYSFAKRQRDLAKKAKKEEKRLRKAGVKSGEIADDTAADDTTAEAAVPPATSGDTPPG